MVENEAMDSRWQQGLLLKCLNAKFLSAVISRGNVGKALIGATFISCLSLATPSFKYAPDFILIQSSYGSEFDPLKAIESLAVKGRAPKTGYSRAAFGPAWADVDKNGCDTRNDILKRDLLNLIFREKSRSCVVESGLLLDPFSGERIEFQRGQKSSYLVQIDHVVALSNAWQSGIFRTDISLRKSFANDPLNLLAVKGSLNSQKGDGDAATWLPPNKVFRCKYVSRQVEVKVKYGLSITRAEKDAILRILNSPLCKTQS